MQVGVMAPQMGHNATAAAMREIGQAAEELGFASVWTADHVVLPRTYESEYPFNDDHRFPMPGARPFLDMFPTLGFLAASTRRITLGVSVCIVPYRQAVLLAKAVATVDQLAEGRFVLGVGVGWLREEFEALGADYGTRGAATDEVLEFLRHTWRAEQPLAFHGRFVDVDEVYLVPASHEGREIPLWVGGHAPAALRRTARFGSAWFPHLYGTSPDAVRKTAGDLGLPVALFVPLELTDADPEVPPWETHTLAGTAGFVARTLRDYAAAGVEHVLLSFGGSTPTRLRIMETLRQEVLPAVRP
jgi:probable F420-dependent oxidoreductase